MSTMLRSLSSRVFSNALRRSIFLASRHAVPPTILRGFALAASQNLNIPVQLASLSAMRMASTATAAAAKKSDTKASAPAKSMKTKPRATAAKAKPKPKPKARAAKKKTRKAKPKPKKAAKKEPVPRPDTPPPKRPINGFLTFHIKNLNSQRDAIEASTDKTKFIAGIAKQSGELWRAMTTEEREAFNAENRAAMQVYQAERQKYYEEMPASTLKGINMRRKKKGKAVIRVKHATQAPRSSYVRFLQEFRQSPDIDARIGGVQGYMRNRHIFIEGAKAWKALSESEKKPYVDAYAKGRAEYMASKA